MTAEYNKRNEGLYWASHSELYILFVYACLLDILLVHIVIIVVLNVCEFI
jgi:hypothetical protein